ncbi:NLR family CARD domain-containing protein 4 [Holothuria leucospilota]|uniref:NLR family CARD domain-containing protein 4 n=1 Tax=Holothuria leucospilota TaxID=206669 RepID=A0A9Q1HB46_HOLLE|nr:NLR family CARD domain-containing protein 4 [Holothuria leucospilota]
MEPQRKEETTSIHGYQQAGIGFGKFMVDLAGFLTVQIVISLATYFGFSTAQKDKLRDAQCPGQLMVDCLTERGIISQTDISPLIKALEFLGLYGVKQEALLSFQLYLSTCHQSSGYSPVGARAYSSQSPELENRYSPVGARGYPSQSPEMQNRKLNQLQRYLRAAYELMYRAIQPIPYIRDKLFCVNDVFVEGGIEIINATDKGDSAVASSSSPPKKQTKPLKSYRDIFNDGMVPSKRVIVEGEPGYGKSTLTLQAAYDWCEQHSPSSALQGVELFILLPLRLLKGIVSVYKAVKLFILPRDCNLLESEIKDIIDSCSSVVIVLDGFDEYPDIDSDINSDFMEIIKGKMFTNFKLILCTRSGCLPSSLDPRTIRVRLTGFDVDARDRYMSNAIVGGSAEKANEIRQNLLKNPIMCDLCQVPLFFVMFAHMANESKDIYKCDSVTSFFKYMLHCFYSHMWKKEEEHGKVSCCTTANTKRLNKVAFNGLAGGNQTLVWDKEQFQMNVGTKCFDELIKIGILIEETFLEINDVPNASLNEYVKERHTVRFYHKLFAEWFAAHYLAELASSLFAFRLNKSLVKVNPSDLQFVLRFACGLKPSATRRIVTYLQGITGGDSYATLCILEKTGGTHDIVDVVKEMCSKRVTFDSHDNQLLQRSRIQLLNIASKNQIPISGVSLVGCFQSVDLKEECLCLSFGLQLPRLDTLKDLAIYGQHDLRDSARNILDFSGASVALGTLTFHSSSGSRSLLPQSFDEKDVLARLHKKNCKVEWYAATVGWVKLNLQTGKWEKTDGLEMADSEYRYVAREFDV